MTDSSIATYQTLRHSVRRGMDLRDKPEDDGGRVFAANRRRRRLAANTTTSVVLGSRAERQRKAGFPGLSVSTPAMWTDFRHPTLFPLLPHSPIPFICLHFPRLPTCQI